MKHRIEPKQEITHLGNLSNKDRCDLRRAILNFVEKEHQPQVLLVFSQRAEGGLTLEPDASQTQPVENCITDAIQLLNTIL